MSMLTGKAIEIALSKRVQQLENVMEIGPTMK